MEPDRNDAIDPQSTTPAATASAPSTAGLPPAAQDWATYASVVSGAQGYQLDEAQLARVTAQLELISAVAAPLLALHLPAEVEPAPVFRP